MIGEKIVFDRANVDALPGWAVVNLGAGFNPIDFRVATDGVPAGYMQVGLQWQGIVRSLVPAVYLYPEASTVASAERAVKAAWIAWALGLVAGGLGCWWAGTALWAMRRLLWSRTAIGLIALVAFAFLLRLVFLLDYACQPNADVLLGGSD